MTVRGEVAVLVRPAVLAALVVALALWERRPAHDVGPPQEAPAREADAAPKQTAEQRRAADERCASASGREFRRAWGEGTVSTEAWAETARFASHYNEKLDACFYLLAIARRLPPTFQDLGPVVLTRKLLYDVNEGELYGEYRGPEAGGAPGAALPSTCRMAGLYCASRREWDRLAMTFMESGAEGP